MTTLGVGTRALHRRRASLYRRGVRAAPGCVAKETDPPGRSDRLKVSADAGLRLSGSQSSFLSVTKTLSCAFQGGLFPHTVSARTRRRNTNSTEDAAAKLAL